MSIDFDAHFHAFLGSTVNLKQYKLDQLDARVTAITNAFQGDAEIGHMYKEHIPQGSWAHQTIIDPVSPFDEFDADILLHLEQNYEWNDDPKKYLQEVRAAFKRNSIYRPKVIRKKRCVRIRYANDCHVDVVPSITLDDGQQAIIYYTDNEFEETNPVGFADWMRERDDITGGQLRRIIRLFKWLRDYKNTFSCPSVILTVMLGNRVQFWDAETKYADVPSTLVSLLEALDLWLQGHHTMPLLDDPSCPGLSFNHRWDEEKYSNFRKKVSDYALWAREAYDLQGEDDQAALTAWQKMFGTEFAADEVAEARTQVVAKKFLLELAGKGAASVNGQKDIAPGEEFITARYGSVQLRYNAAIRATIPGPRCNRLLRRERVVGIHRTLKFHLSTDVPEPYEVLWKVRNRGAEAAKVPGGLRGQIRYGGNEGRNDHQESTLYRGTHYVEAYVVKNGVVVASDHHEVRII
jgi:hypothetical protein